MLFKITLHHSIEVFANTVRCRTRSGSLLRTTLIVFWTEHLKNRKNLNIRLDHLEGSHFRTRGFDNFK